MASELPSADTSSAATPAKPGIGIPRWPALITFLALGVMYVLVSDRFTFGPSWLLLAVVVVMLVPITIARMQGYRRVVRFLSLALTSLATVGVGVSALFLVTRLTQASDGLQGKPLLQDAALVWGANVLIFALWYWQIDAGGPAQRRRDHHTSTDFIFPQMTLQDSPIKDTWSPDFIDYLFLAFNTSTAFSPTDTLVLSRPAKLLMMAQSLISLVVIAVLAARAVNTFQ